jgi:putative ATPase
LQELRATLSAAENLRKFGRQTTLFIDEIHRFSKLQQDALLPAVENGTIHLIAATTENPSFYCNNALLSRCRVLELQKLSPTELLHIIARAEARLTPPGQFSPTVHRKIAEAADGDARIALNLLELAHNLSKSQQLTEAELLAKLSRSHVTFDRDGDEHYNVISAMHKSLRGNDANAAIYWLARQLKGGEGMFPSPRCNCFYCSFWHTHDCFLLIDPRYIARRLVVFASEDVGLANPQALMVAISTFHAVTMIGMPECEINLAHCVRYVPVC